MRKFTILLAVAIIAAQSVGCGCCNRLRDWLCRGAYCGAPAQTYVSPAPCAVPAPIAYGAPVAATCPTCTTCPQQCYPMETSFEPSCDYGAGMPMYTDGGGWAPSGTAAPGGVIVDPAPAP